MERFDKENLPTLFEQLAGGHRDFRSIIEEWGHPPLWIRPNTFETLVLTILEQQVSLASAYAAYTKLKEKITITPRNLLKLSEEDLRSCYFSRQKILYTRGLASAILSKQINLKKFETLPDEVVRAELKALKGIGDWTVDIYLIHALGRTDVFPIGDLALVNAIKMARQDPQLTREDILRLSESWKPYRSVATLLFWHFYIKKKNISRFPLHIKPAVHADHLASDIAAHVGGEEQRYVGNIFGSAEFSERNA